jgi:hypothetical protein
MLIGKPRTGSPGKKTVPAGEMEVGLGLAGVSYGWGAVGVAVNLIRGQETIHECKGIKIAIQRVELKLHAGQLFPATFTRDVSVGDGHLTSYNIRNPGACATARRCRN